MKFTAYHTTDISNYSFLVTGGAGFVGSNIVDYLMQFEAKRVVVLDNLCSGSIDNIKQHIGKPNFQFIEGDITNIHTCNEVTKDIDFISHQAALGSVPRSIKSPIPTHDSNASGFLNMLHSAKENNVKRFVYASSSSVYGDSTELPKKEENIGTPLSPYAVTKRVNELYAQVFSSTYDFETIGLRYFNIFGPKQNPKGPYAAVIPLFLEAIIDDKEAFINGDGGQTRDFTFVANAVQANIKALFSPANLSGKVFNIACGERISISTLFNEIALACDKIASPTHRDDRIGDIRDSIANIDKAKNELNYQPDTFLKEGIQMTIDWFINAHQKESSCHS